MPTPEDVARACLLGAEQDTMAFPQIVATLIEAGFESYLIDFRRDRAIYYRPDGSPVEFETHRDANSVAASLNAEALKAAIAEAQALAPGYTYCGFCAKAKRAGCAGYLVSFSGRRALYFGRTAETHIEHFPPAP